MPSVICLRGATWRLFPCRLWRGATNSAGYGTVRRSSPRRNVLVHREALELALGRSLGPGIQSLHHCDTPACYEPMHLFEGTQADNIADMIAKGRHWGQRLTRCRNDLHDMTPENTRIYRGGRWCLACWLVTRGRAAQAAPVYNAARRKRWAEQRKKDGYPPPNGGRKLSPEQRAEAKRLYAAGGVFQRELAVMFDVSQITISRIIGDRHGRHPQKNPELSIRAEQGEQ